MDFKEQPKFEMILVHAGNCRYLVGNKIYPLRPGDLLLLYGKTIQSAYLFDESETYERSIIQFHSKWLQPLLEELGVAYLLDLFSENRNGKIRLFSKEDAEAIEHSFLKIDQLNDLTHNYKHEALRKIMITGLLLRIDLSTVAIRDKGRIYKNEKIKIAEDVLTYIFKYYRDAIAIEDIANGLELSKSYISHVFKEMTGFSIMNYLMRYRLSASTSALLTGQTKSIKEIAYEHGFESDAHFSRFFKKNVGQTPNRFRKSYSL